LVASLFVTAWAAAPAAAQQTDVRPRFGLGLDAHANTREGFGPGLRLRVSAPLNADLSVAFSMAAIGFVLQGRDEATYAIDPQASLIVTLPPSSRAPNRVTYILGGVGAYVPLGDDGETAPSLHLGLGRAHALTDISFYYEFDPAILIGEESVQFTFPLRFGLIF
jgi:hypothetical protein